MARYFMSDTRLGWLEKMMMDPSRTPSTTLKNSCGLLAARVFHIKVEWARGGF